MLTSFWLIVGTRVIREMIGQRGRLIQFMSFASAQFMLLFLYPAYEALFRLAEGSRYELPVILVLPILKVLVRNVALRCVARMEDMAPAVVMFTVDFFNAMYMATCMQTASSISAIAAITFADISQTGSTLYGLHQRTYSSFSGFCPEKESLLTVVCLWCRDVKQFERYDSADIRIRSCLTRHLTIADGNILDMLDKMPRKQGSKYDQTHISSTPGGCTTHSRLQVCFLRHQNTSTIYPVGPQNILSAWEGEKPMWTLRGLSELDAALGGGLLLQTLNLVESPAESDDSLDLSAGASEALAGDLLRYFVAEAVADGKQRVVLVAPAAADFVRSHLPLELSLAQRQVKQQLADTKQEDAPLTIAWQYGKYDHQRQTHKQRFCHSFDLSRPMHREMLEANGPIAIDPLEWTTEDVGDVYERIFLAVEELVQQENDGGQVLRVGLLGLGSPLFGAPDAAHMMALFSFVRRLRALLAQSKNVVCLALLGSDALSSFPAAFVNELRHASDSVLTLSSFAGTRDLLPEELLEFQGSLTLRKLPRVHALACHAPSNTRFGVKRDRRKLKIDKFHLPPEGSRSSNSSNKSSGCGGSSNTADPLAF
ncbi:unnamed protein product [Phytophthora lilii]|uniref:Elongator complex protein 4 n=1 Tax=Phytophthora lilii TaxID=2077276 RepID=A0A9W6TVY4_9STRA|nr:unnamed protein product [Phytophthora lilii]